MTSSTINDSKELMMTSSNATDSEFGEPYSFTLAEIWISSIFYIILITTSLIGNFLIMGVVYSNKRMRTVTHYFIINNAVADLLVTVIGMPMAAREQILGIDTISLGGIRGEVFCKIYTLTQSMSCNTSILTLVAIAIDRFCATFFPFKRLVTMRRAKWIMFMIWLLSVVLELPMFYMVHIALDPYNGEYYCMTKWSVYSSLGSVTQLEHFYTVFMFVILYALPLVIISILYGIMITKIWKRKIPGQETAVALEIQNKTKKIVLKMLITVVICFAICWLPYHLLFFIYPAPDYSPLNIWLFARFMMYSNSSVTPWIYLIYSKDYRNGVQRILLRFICKKLPADMPFSAASSVSLRREPRRTIGGTIMLKAFTNTICDAEDVANRK